MNHSLESTKTITPGPLPAQGSTFRRLMRLAVGTVLVGQDYLRTQLPIWEAEVARRQAENAQRPTPLTTLPERSASAHPAPWTSKSGAAPLENRLVGLALETPHYIKSGFTALWRTEQKIWHKTAPLRYPLDWLGITDMTQRTLDRVTRRAQADSERLERIGEAELQPSRDMASVAIADIYGKVLDLLAQSPEIRGLIAQQSAGVTTEVIREVRERTVSADSMADSITRRILRKRPKAEPDKFLPKQSEETRDPDW